MEKLSVPASSLASLRYGMSHKEVALSIFLRFLGIKQGINEAIKHGIETEPVVIELLSQRDIVKTDSKARVFQDITLSATPDLIENKGKENQNLIEIKSPYYTYITDSGLEKRSKTLEDYYEIYKLQCNIQMYCFECYKLDFIVYSNEEIHILKVEYDEFIIHEYKTDFKKIWDELLRINERYSDFNSIEDKCEMVIFLKKNIESIQKRFEISIEEIRKILDDQRCEIATGEGSIKFNKNGVNIKTD